MAARPCLPCHQPQVHVAGRLLGGSAGPALRGQIPRLLHGACGCVFKAYVRPTVDVVAAGPTNRRRRRATSWSSASRWLALRRETRPPAGSTSPAALGLCNGFRRRPAYRRLLRRGGPRREQR
jgi:hypothetical protein